MRELVRRVVARQRTACEDPAPQFAGVTGEILTCKRADGVQLPATMYLPARYKKADGPLPFFSWAYSQEFKAGAARSGACNRTLTPFGFQKGRSARTGRHARSAPPTTTPAPCPCRASATSPRTVNWLGTYVHAGSPRPALVP